MFANSCDSANPALSASQDYVHLLHHAFLRQGVPSISGPSQRSLTITMQRRGADPAAEFASSFYRSLAIGLSIGDALGMARREFFGRERLFGLITCITETLLIGFYWSRFHPKMALPATKIVFKQPWGASDLFAGRFKELRAIRENLKALSQEHPHSAHFGPGWGRTVLMKRLLSDANRYVPCVVSAAGACQRQAGTAEPYLPFKVIFRALVRSSEPLANPQPEADTVGTLVATELFCHHLFALVRPDLEVGPSQVERICACLGVQPQSLNVASPKCDHSIVFDETLTLLGMPIPGISDSFGYRGSALG